jgi:UDP-glucuronate decarboxylase
MLDLAKRCNARIVQASTSEIYGDPMIAIQDEDYWGNVNPIGVRSCYDEGKRCAETLFTDYRRQYSLDTRIARIFNTYGPKMSRNDGRVVSNFIVQALDDLPLTIYGNGRQTRSFCYVDDLVEGLVSLFFIEADTVDRPINLGNPAPITMHDLAVEILRLVPESNSDIVYQELPEDDPVQRCPDISKATEILGWKPQIDRAQGLRSTIDYFRKLKFESPQSA